MKTLVLSDEPDPNLGETEGDGIGDGWGSGDGYGDGANYGWSDGTGGLKQDEDTSVKR